MGILIRDLRFECKKTLITHRFPLAWKPGESRDSSTRRLSLHKNYATI